MNQYQKELAEVVKSGKDVDQFKKDWHKRACAAYRNNVTTNEDINKFRSGEFEI